MKWCNQIFTVIDSHSKYKCCLINLNEMNFTLSNVILIVQMEMKPFLHVQYCTHYCFHFPFLFLLASVYTFSPLLIVIPSNVLHVCICFVLLRIARYHFHPFCVHALAYKYVWVQFFFIANKQQPNGRYQHKVVLFFSKSFGKSW